MNKIIKKQLLNAIKNKNIIKIRNITHKISIPDAISILENFDINEVLIFLRSLDTEKMADIFEKISAKKQAKIIERFSDERNKKLFDELFVDEIADIIDELPENLVTKILKNTTKEKRKIINKILSYSDDDTGSIMSVDIVKIEYNWTVKEALNFIQKHNEDKEETLHYYVINSNKKLEGMVKIQDLAFSSLNTKISDIIEFTPFLMTKLDKEKAAIEFQKHDYSELPVVDSHYQLVGIVTSDDVLDVLVEEFSEDAQISAGIMPIHQSYLKTSIYKLSRSRFFWLFFLMFSATLSQFVLQSFISIYDDLFTSVGNSTVIAVGASSIIALLVSILPDISGTSGNAGTQSSTLITRSLATGELTTKDTGKVLWKEIRVGLIVGAALGTANFVRLIIYYAVAGEISNFDHYTRNVFISLGASIAMWVVILISKIVGGLLPLLAVKLKMDPAIMSAPLLTTIIDSLSIAIFFSINILILFYTGFMH